MQEKKVVLIPFWVQDILHRNKLPLSTCLDFPKLRQLVAINDLVTFYTLQNYSSKILGAEMPTGLFWAWLKSIPETGDGEDNRAHDMILTLAGDESFRKEVETRLLEADSKSDLHEKPFIIYDLSPEVCGVVIYPGFFTPVNIKQYPELQEELLEAVLKALYVYDSYHEVAGSPLFKRYLELLSCH